METVIYTRFDLAMVVQTFGNAQKLGNGNWSVRWMSNGWGQPGS